MYRKLIDPAIQLKGALFCVNIMQGALLMVMEVEYLRLLMEWTTEFQELLTQSFVDEPFHLVDVFSDTDTDCSSWMYLENELPVVLANKLLRSHTRTSVSNFEVH